MRHDHPTRTLLERRAVPKVRLHHNPGLNAAPACPHGTPGGHTSASAATCSPAHCQCVQRRGLHPGSPVSRVPPSYLSGGGRGARGSWGVGPGLPACFPELDFLTCKVALEARWGPSPGVTQHWTLGAAGPAHRGPSPCRHGVWGRTSKTSRKRHCFSVPGGPAVTPFQSHFYSVLSTWSACPDPSRIAGAQSMLGTHGMGSRVSSFRWVSAAPWP